MEVGQGPNWGCCANEKKRIHWNDAVTWVRSTSSHVGFVVYKLTLVAGFPQLSWLTSCRAYNISTRTAHKTPFLFLCLKWFAIPKFSLLGWPFKGHISSKYYIVRTTQETHYVSAIETIRLMLFIVRIIRNTQIHSVGRMRSLLKQVVPVLTTRL
jgi:hypothetical protein